MSITNDRYAMCFCARGLIRSKVFLPRKTSEGIGCSVLGVLSLQLSWS
jgi:hypothetical protein